MAQVPLIALLVIHLISDHFHLINKCNCASRYYDDGTDNPEC